MVHNAITIIISVVLAFVFGYSFGEQSGYWKGVKALHDAQTEDGSEVR